MSDAANLAGAEPSSTSSPEDVATRVREFYGQAPFPGVRVLDQDGLILMRRIRRQAAFKRSLKVLDAGCGTGNTTASLARMLPDVEFLGVDICPASIAAARRATDDLENVRFIDGDLVELGSANAAFDVILCLGVLHHTSDMPAVLANFQRLLADRGQLYLWVYGAHGRHHHLLNQRLLRMLLDERQSLSSRVEVAREFALGTSGGKPLQDLYGDCTANQEWTRMILNDSWIADQFLHVHERSLEMAQLQELLEDSGFALIEWLGVDESAAGKIAPAALADKLAALPDRQRRIALDLVLKPRHYFVMAARPEGRERDA